MKVIFLDIDGVMNSKAWLSQSPVSFGPGMIDPDCIKRLRVLASWSGARVVLSSTWRLQKETDDWFKQLRFPPIFSRTPNLSGPRSRGDEIQFWLDANRVDKFVILDDEDDMLPSHQSKLVLVNPDVGLTDMDLLKAMEILEGS